MCPSAAANGSSSDPDMDDLINPVCPEMDEDEMKRSFFERAWRHSTLDIPPGEFDVAKESCFRGEIPLEILSQTFSKKRQLLQNLLVEYEGKQAVMGTQTRWAAGWLLATKRFEPLSEWAVKEFRRTGRPLSSAVIRDAENDKDPR